MNSLLKPNLNLVELPQVKEEREMPREMTSFKRWTFGAIVFLAIATVAVFGASRLSATAHADTPTPTPSTTASTFVSNEDPAHEAAETAAQEAAEDSGQRSAGAMRGSPNEDAAHEAAETPAQEAVEHAASPTTP
jgi:type IV secretory pathway VirB10-like protein